MGTVGRRGWEPAARQRPPLDRWEADNHRTVGDRATETEDGPLRGKNGDWTLQRGAEHHLGSARRSWCKWSLVLGVESCSPRYKCRPLTRGSLSAGASNGAPVRDPTMPRVDARRFPAVASNGAQARAWKKPAMWRILGRASASFLKGGQ